MAFLSFLTPVTLVAGFFFFFGTRGGNVQKMTMLNLSDILRGRLKLR